MMTPLRFKNERGNGAKQSSRQGGYKHTAWALEDPLMSARGGQKDLVRYSTAPVRNGRDDNLKCNLVAGAV